MILLLVQVGMEMDLGELGKVGRASLSVATIGVVIPLLLGLGAMQIVGDTFNTSLFVAAALTATSVGITARVFGDLRALATTEARVVLGAAVADDVMGLVVLTVVVRLVTQGSVSTLSVLGVVAVAIAFLVVGGGAAMFVAPPLFDLIERRSRSAGTLVVMAMVFTLGMAELASVAKLATIVGRLPRRPRVHPNRAERPDPSRADARSATCSFRCSSSRSASTAQLSAFGDLSVLRDAGILLVVAVIGKLLAAIGARRTRGDGWLIGLGMLPRGEVGLIFATIGLQSHVLGAHLYASLLLVVLVTTLMTPPLLKARYSRLRCTARRIRRRTTLATATAPPSGGWFFVDDGVVRLSARPSKDWVLAVAFDAAIEASNARPSTELLEYIHDHLADVDWDCRRLRRPFGAWSPWAHPAPGTSWKPSGSSRSHCPSSPRPSRPGTRTHSWSTPDMRTGSPPWNGCGPFPKTRTCASSSTGWPIPSGSCSRRCSSKGCVPDRAATPKRPRSPTAPASAPWAPPRSSGLVADDNRLRTIAARPDAFDEEEVLQLASHLDNPERARAGFLLAIVGEDDLPSFERERMLALHDLVQRALKDPSLTGSDARNLIERRRTEAMMLASDQPSAGPEHSPGTAQLPGAPAARDDRATRRSWPDPRWNPRRCGSTSATPRAAAGGSRSERATVRGSWRR